MREHLDPVYIIGIGIQFAVVYYACNVLCAAISCAGGLGYARGDFSLLAEGMFGVVCAREYRRGGKTLCSLYARENCIGFIVIFGKDARTKFEKERDCYSKETQTIYDKAQTYHDGKWMMFEPTDTALFSDVMRLLSIKRKPNR